MPSVLRSSGHRRQALGHRVGRTFQDDLALSYAQLAGVGAVQAEHQPDQFGAARTEQTTQAQNLTGAQAQVGRGDLATALQRMRFQHRRTLLHRGRLHSVASADSDLATDHGRHQRPMRQGRSRVLAYQAAVAQDGDAVGNRIHLIQKMSDEQDRHALFAQTAYHREQLLHLTLVQARGRFVQDQYLGRYAQRACDGDHLLHRHREVRQWPFRVDVQVQPGQHLASVGVDRIPVDGPGPAPAGIAAADDVLGYRQVRAQVHFLVDRADAQVLRLRPEWTATPPVRSPTSLRCPGASPRPAI